jgi:hypothetical protein
MGVCKTGKNPFLAELALLKNSQLLKLGQQSKS